MTYIEFFDKNIAENICASLVSPPDRVVLVGDKAKVLKKHAQRYQEFFLERGYSVEFECRTVNKNHLQSIVTLLTELVETYSDCVFDLTGGEDLYLVAVGIVSERYPNKKIQMQRVNIRSNTVTDCDAGVVADLESCALQISIEENLKIYGGQLVWHTQQENGTYPWDMHQAFREDLRFMWELCKGNVRLWNAQIGVLEAANVLCKAPPDPLTITVSAPRLKAELKRHGGRLISVHGLLEKLISRGLITHYDNGPERFTVSFQNEQAKRCLTKAGQVLELWIYMAAQDALDKDGRPVYPEVLTGVCIDWDGELHPEETAFDTQNEIDVMMMHGLIPVFVSCKNGTVTMDELYKLNTVAEHFGGRYARRVLVATALDSEGTFDEYFRQRAKDMNIRLVEGITEMHEEALRKTVKSFWCN